MEPPLLPLGTQIVWLLVLAMPVACVAWSVTHEELFRELRERCEALSENCRQAYQRKFFYVFTCEYCFSHYVALLVLWMSGFRMLSDGWRGFLVAWFALVWIANQYMSFFARIRVSIRSERVDIELKEEVVKSD